MIVFDLHCQTSGDRFEAWFRSNADFERQLEQGLVQCPVCQSTQVTKAPMAPRVPRKGDGGSNFGEAMAKLASLQAELLRNSKWVTSLSRQPLICSSMSGEISSAKADSLNMTACSAQASRRSSEITAFDISRRSQARIRDVPD